MYTTRKTQASMETPPRSAGGEKLWTKEMKKETHTNMRKHMRARLRTYKNGEREKTKTNKWQSLSPPHKIKKHATQNRTSAGSSETATQQPTSIRHRSPQPPPTRTWSTAAPLAFPFRDDVSVFHLLLPPPPPPWRVCVEHKTFAPLHLPYFV